MPSNETSVSIRTPRRRDSAEDSVVSKDSSTVDVAAIDRLVSPPPHQLSKAMHHKMRILEATQDTLRVDIRSTVASFLFGYASDRESKVFDLIVRRHTTSRILWALWWTGILGGLILLWFDSPSLCACCSLLMLPLPCLTSLVLSLDLVYLLLMQFETYIVTAFHLYVCWSSARLLGDARLCFWVFYSPTIIAATFVDAYPSAYRRSFSRMFFCGVLGLLLTWGGLLAFDLGLRIYDKPIWVGNYRSTVASSSLTSLATVALFCLKNVGLTMFRPEQFTLIRSSVRSTVVEVDEVTVHEGSGKPVTDYKPQRGDVKSLADLVAQAEAAYATDSRRQASTSTRDSLRVDDVVLRCRDEAQADLRAERTTRRSLSAQEAARDAVPAARGRTARGRSASPCAPVASVLHCAFCIP